MHPSSATFRNAKIADKHDDNFSFRLELLVNLAYVALQNTDILDLYVF